MRVYVCECICMCVCAYYVYMCLFSDVSVVQVVNK